MKMTRFGVIRNGEHLRLFDTERAAQEHLAFCKMVEEDMVYKGWITKEQAEKTQWQIKKVRSNVW